MGRSLLRLLVILAFVAGCLPTTTQGTHQHGVSSVDAADDAAQPTGVIDDYAPAAPGVELPPVSRVCGEELVHASPAAPRIVDRLGFAPKTSPPSAA